MMKHCTGTPANQLLPEKQREQFHLELGRQIWIKIVCRRCGQVATSCLHAGAKTAKTSAFCTAAVYCKLGLKLLNKGKCKKNYELALRLNNSAVEMVMCTANFERTKDEIVAML